MMLRFVQQKVLFRWLALAATILLLLVSGGRVRGEKNKVFKAICIPTTDGNYPPRYQIEVGGRNSGKVILYYIDGNRLIKVEEEFFNSYGISIKFKNLVKEKDYLVEIDGELKDLAISYCKEIKDWGNKEWERWNPFKSYLERLPNTPPNLKKIKNLSNIFENSNKFNQDISNWDVSNITNMFGMFWTAKNFNQPIGKWDVRNVENMADMFYYAEAFDQNLGAWQLRKVKEIGLSFSGMSAVNYSLSLEGWAKQPEIARGVKIKAHKLKYLKIAKWARDYLIKEKAWSFEGDEEDDRDFYFMPFVGVWPEDAGSVYGKKNTLIVNKNEFRSGNVMRGTYSYKTSWEDSELYEKTTYGGIIARKEGKARVRVTGYYDNGKPAAYCYCDVTVGPAIERIDLFSSTEFMFSKCEDEIEVVGKVYPKTVLDKRLGFHYDLKNLSQRRIVYTDEGTTIFLKVEASVPDVMTDSYVEAQPYTQSSLVEEKFPRIKNKIAATIFPCCTGIELTYSGDAYHTSQRVDIYKGDYCVIGAQPQPYGKVPLWVEWEVAQNEFVETKTDGTLELKGVKRGEVNVVVKTKLKPVQKREFKVRVLDPVESVKLSKNKIEAFVDRELDLGQLEVTVLPETVDDKSVVWNSENTAIIDRYYSGLKAKTKGKTRIYCETKAKPNKRAYCNVTVVRAVDHVELDISNKKLLKDAKFKLSAKVFPKDVPSQEVEWSVSKEGVVSVTKDGTVKAVGAGEVEVIARSKSRPVKEAKCKVRVYLHPKSVTIVPETLNFIYGTSDNIGINKFRFNVLPKEAEQEVNWGTENPQLLEFYPEDAYYIARFRVKGKGHTRIYCETKAEPHVRAYCIVNIGERASSISLNTNQLSLLRHGVKQLLATVSPSDVVTNEVVWTSDPAGVVEIDAQGNVRGLTVGTTTITATTKAEPGRTAKCKVSVLEPATGLTLNKESLRLYLGGSHGNNQFKLEGTISPNSVVNKRIVWRSENKDVADVQSDGTVVARGVGKTIIFAETEAEPVQKAQCDVSVIVPVESFTIVNKLNLFVNGKASLNPQLLPESLANKRVIYTAEPAGYITVSETGEVTAGAQTGVVTITAKTEAEPVATQTCVVTIDNPVDRVALKESTYLFVGGTEQLTAEVYPEDLSDRGVNWESENKEIVSVDPDGTLHALKQGVCKVFARAKLDATKEASCEVTVSIPVESITIKNKLSIVLGHEKKLAVTIKPKELLDKELIWHTEPEGVVQVDADGTVHSQAVGTTTITVTTHARPQKSAMCSVEVLQPVESLEVPEHIDVYVDATEQIVAKVLPATVTNQKVYWRSDASGIAKVNSEGVVTGVSVGKTKLHAETAALDKDLKTVRATTEVEVWQKATRVWLDEQEKNLKVGEEYTFHVHVEPADANQAVEWSVEGEDGVISINSEGKIEALRTGSVQVVATTKAKPNLQARCPVTVTQSVSSLTLNETELTLDLGARFQLIATVLPASLPAEDKRVSWSSSNASVVYVDNNGNLEVRGFGDVTIEARCGGRTATCQVHVPEKVSSITLDQTQLHLEVGQQGKLVATVYPEALSNRRVEWEVVEGQDKLQWEIIDNQCMVVAKGEGQAKIVAKAEADQSYTIQCVVTVSPKTEVHLDKTQLTLQLGKTYKFNPTVMPKPKDAVKFRFWVEDTDIATIEQDGTLTARYEGETDVYVAFTGESSARATCHLIVSAAATAVTLNKLEIYHWLGNDIEQLEATVYPLNLRERRVTWTSSNPNVLSVDEHSGNLSVHDKGYARITVMTVAPPAKTAFCDVYIQAPQRLNSIYITEQSILVSEGTGHQLRVNFVPEHFPDQRLRFEVKDSDIAEVNNEGYVVGKRRGKTEVYAFSQAASDVRKAVCIVEVGDVIPLQNIAFNFNKLYIAVGLSQSNLVRFVPTKASDQHLRWTIDNDRIVSIDKYGVLHAKMLGTTTISAYSEQLDKTISLEVEVVDIIRVSSVTLSQEQLHLDVNESKQLLATVQPDNASDKRVTWSSSNSDIAEVLQSGEVTGKKDGIANIIVTSEEGKRVAVCSVSVGRGAVVEDLLLGKVEVMPNPFNNLLRIVVHEVLGAISYELLTVDGSKIAHGEFVGQEYQLSTDTLESGLYLLRLRTSTGASQTVKVLKY